MKTRAFIPDQTLRHIAANLCVIALLGALLFGCGRKLMVSGTEYDLPDLAAARYVGTDACKGCHQSAYAAYLSSAHAPKAASAQARNVNGCEQCHGPGSIHLQRLGDPGAVYCFSRLPAPHSSKLCLTCHRVDKIADWPANSHALAQISCSACHPAHAEAEKSHDFKGSGRCLSCHPKKKAAALLPSRHPLKEGKMTCTSCHDSHGAEPKMLKKSAVNELCLDCHAEYQGPFVHEHPPVTEDCTICHDPHGAIENNLLRQGEPFLCLRCHRAHRSDPEDGAFTANTALLTSCSQCHAEIHGTDVAPRHIRKHGR